MPKALRRPDITHPELAEGDNKMFARHAPQYSDMCPVCGPRLKARQMKERAVPVLHKAFREFGYTSLTVDEVGESYDRAMAGTTRPADIIDRLVLGQLREAGLVPQEIR